MSKYVFPSANGRKPADIRSAWDNAIKEANLRGVTLHTLRHTAASHMAMNGFSALEIGFILGHKTLAMVKRYSHLSVSSVAQALDHMNEKLFNRCING